MEEGNDSFPLGGFPSGAHQDFDMKSPVESASVNISAFNQQIFKLIMTG